MENLNAAPPSRPAVIAFRNFARLAFSPGLKYASRNARLNPGRPTGHPEHLPSAPEITRLGKSVNRAPALN